MESDGFDDFVTIEKEDAENMENNDNDFLDENIEEDDYEGTFISVSMPNPIKKVDLVKTSAIFETKNNFSLLNSIKSMASSIYYNHFNSSDKFDLENPKYINNTDCIIFSKKLKNRTIAQKTITSSIISNALRTVLYMTYRNGFDNLKNIADNGRGKSITTDCGWGCMLRSCQMMMSKGIIERKIYKFLIDNQKNVTSITGDIIDRLRKETALLFFDNSLPVELVTNNEDFKLFWKKYIDIVNKEQNLKEREKYNALLRVAPPFSIQTLCKIADCAGKWTSDFNMIKAFMEINTQLFDNEDGMIYINSGDIREDDIYKTFCEELKCDCKKKQSICDECLNKILIERNIKAKSPLIFSNANKTYLFIKGGLIFISFRLGLHQIEKEFISSIPLLLLNFKNNIGFVSGKNNKAFYFVGVGNHKLLYLDPHLNQPSVKDNWDNLETYVASPLYTLSAYKMSGALSLGIVINNELDLVDFIKSAKEQALSNPKIIRVVS